MLKRLLRIDCERGKHLCDKNQYKEASFLEKISLTIHLIFCQSCREYTKKNNALTKLVKNPKLQTMSSANKSDLKTRMAEELAKQNNK